MSTQFLQFPDMVNVIYYSHWRRNTHKSLNKHQCTSYHSQRCPGEYKATPTDHVPPFKGQPQVDYLSLGLGNFESSSRPTLLTAAIGHTSYSLLVYRLAKPRADSPISYALRLI